MFASSVLRPPSACYGLASFQYKDPVREQRSAQSAAAAAAPQRVMLFIPAAMEMKGGGWQNAVIGPVLQCMEAATLGMPLEVWKTYMGRNRGATTLGAISSIYQQGGGGFPGVAAFWAGTGPKVWLLKQLVLHSVDCMRSLHPKSCIASPARGDSRQRH